MAWTRQLKSGKYEGRYRIPGGKTRTVAGGPFTHKREARRQAEAAEAESRTLGWRDPQAAGRTWGEWCEEWWPSRTVAANTLMTDISRRDVHLIPRWADVPLCDITRQDVKKWAAELRSTSDDKGNVEIHHAAQTVKNIVNLFSSSLRAAVDAEVLDANVAADLHLPTSPPGKERFLTREEYNKLLAQLDGVDRAIVLLLAGTGMRWGEAIGLHRSRIDLRRGEIDVVEAHVIRTGKIKPVPKGKRMRSVPIADFVDLSALDDDGPATCGLTHEEGECRSGLLFTDDDGDPITHAAFTGRWKKAVKAAELGHVRPHDLRHTYASWLLQGGRSIAEVGQLLGHISTSTTERYAHLKRTASKEVLAALSGPADVVVDELAARRARRRGGSASA